MRRLRQKPPSRKHRPHVPRTDQEKKLFGEVLREELAKALAPAVRKVVGA